MKTWKPLLQVVGLSTTESKAVSVECPLLKPDWFVVPLCCIKSKVNVATYQEILEHYLLLSADKLYGDADFLF